MTQPKAIPASPGGILRLKLYYERNEARIAILFFIGGFVFDMIMVDRVDSWFTIGQQIAYIALVMTIMTRMLLEGAGPPPDPAGMSAVKRWYYRYRTAIANFFLGTLLNLYTIFFFKSSSLLVSFAFLLVLVFLLLVNEFNRFKWLGLSFKFALLSLCILSFSASVVPIFAGSIGLGVFLLSMLAGCLPLIFVGWWIRKRVPDLFRQARRQILLPFGAVLLVFLASYFFKVIPPVPLSIPFIGVYHSVERTEEVYRLSHERPLWRFWHNGDQEFLARPGDKVFVFFRIFSPTRFSDQVLMRWYWKEGSRWTLQDSIAIKIVGGREHGFRGFGFKSNYQPGDWKVQVETTDLREIGRVYFRLETGPEWPRNFEIDIQ
jgi:Protein of unknown function (DUF2914)